MTQTADSSRPPGRVSRAARTQRTVQRILEAATRLFLDEGYARTSLDQVAAAAGVTKPTVYSHFQSKEGLLRAVTEANAAKRITLLRSVLRPSGDARADLVRFGDLLLEKVLSEEARRWDRLAAAESLDHPEVGEAFFQAGPALVLERLSAYLKQQKRAGRLSMPSPQRAADQLVGMLLCMDLLRSQVGQPTLRASQRKRRCREAVDAFLAAYAGPAP